jgi:hypothetical protein
LAISRLCASAAMSALAAAAYASKAGTIQNYRLQASKTIHDLRSPI